MPKKMNQSFRKLASESRLTSTNVLTHYFAVSKGQQKPGRQTATFSGSYVVYIAVIVCVQEDFERRSA